MKTAFIASDRKHRAPPGSVRSPQFRRMVGLVWPHRRFILLGLLASVGFAIFNAASISGVVPILKILLSPEGVHGWLDRTAAQARLGAELDAYEPSAVTAEGAGAGPFIIINRIDSTSRMPDAGIEPLDLICSINGEAAPAYECFRRIADLPAGATIRLGVTAIDEAGAELSEREVTLETPPFHWRAARKAASLIPREQTDRDRFRTLVYTLVALAVAVIISNTFRFLAQYCIAVGTFRAMMDLRRTLYEQVLRLPMSFFAHNISDLVSRFVQDVLEIQRGLMALLGRLLREPLRAGAVFAVALCLNWRVTVIMLAVTPAAIVLFWYVGRKIRRASRRLLRGYGAMIGTLEATLNAMSIIKAYTSEPFERRRLWQIDRRVFRQQVRIATLEAFLKPMLEVIAVVAIMGVAAWLGSAVIENRMKPDEFFGLVFVLGMMFEPLRNVGDLYARVQRSAAGAQRIFAVLDSPAEDELMEGAIDLPPVRESIEFRNVTFRYPDTTAPVLRHVNLFVTRGEVVAIAGPNGSGKTTLMNLLLRFYDPQEGEILLDGRNIRHASLRSLRKQFSLVTQDAVVFAASMADNIAYGASDASEADVIAAANRAYADEFIRAMPDGYATVSGERGTTLSGGQRQRVSIARAILRDAPILIFDEATSQIDADSEAKIQNALKDFAAGRTTFIIAHRLSTIKFADRIVVLDKGQVVDTGVHDELLKRCPLYQVLCQTQLVE